ncbi:MAG: hypothetical protein NC924_00410 [Candidatus Omnitrophica bacterium]|nr:hypothetical protein [Candidatus Omnitrophota bacterium]
MKKHARLISVVTAVFFGVVISGCESLRTYEKYEYRQLESRLTTVGLEPEKEKNPTTAGALNILPGIGNAYLGQWGIFVVNLLFWPVSIVWGIPQAYADAEVINQKETLYFYKFGPGKAELERLEREQGIVFHPEDVEIAESSPNLPAVPDRTTPRSRRQRKQED